MVVRCNDAISSMNSLFLVVYSHSGLNEITFLFD